MSEITWRAMTDRGCLLPSRMGATREDSFRAIQSEYDIAVLQLTEQLDENARSLASICLDGCVIVFVAERYQRFSIVDPHFAPRIPSPLIYVAPVAVEWQLQSKKLQYLVRASKLVNQPGPGEMIEQRIFLEYSYQSNFGGQTQIQIGLCYNHEDEDLRAFGCDPYGCETMVSFQ